MVRTVLLAALVALVTSRAAFAETPAGTPAGQASSTPPLRLDLVRTSPEAIAPGGDITASMHLVNTSATQTVWVVKPGDGSEMGWREPWVHYSGELVHRDGEVRKLWPALVGRCGLYDADWAKDIVALKPGERLDLHTWIPEPSRALAVDRIGRATMRAHYTFRGGVSDRFPEGVTGPHSLVGMPAFEIVSAPIHVTVESPLVLVVTPNPSPPRLQVGKPVKLSHLFGVAIENTTKNSVAVTTPGGPEVFRIESIPEGYLPRVDGLLTRSRPTTVTIKPGARLSLIGRGGVFSDDADGTWTPSRAGTFVLRVVFDESEVGRLKRRLASDTFTVEVLP